MTSSASEPRAAEPRAAEPEAAPQRFIDTEKNGSFKRGIFNAIIAPRPIGWIGTLDKDGKANLAPFSYFTLVSSLPPIVAFSCNTPEDRELKDTLTNVMETGEFTYNMPSLDLVHQMNATSSPLPRGEDEFEFAGLKKAASLKIRTPRVADSPVSFECKVDRIVKLGEGADEVPTHVTFGRVVGVHINEDYIDENGNFLTALAQPVARLGGIQYAVSAPTFELARQFKRAAETSY
jgi:flavin reductase (DIM6/NTAB) family NADH-FMN oxidoreductase RutF